MQHVANDMVNDWDKNELCLIWLSTQSASKLARDTTLVCFSKVQTLDCKKINIRHLNRKNWKVEILNL